MVDTNDNHRAYLVSSEVKSSRPEKPAMTLEEQKVRQAMKLLDRANKILDEAYKAHCHNQEKEND